MLNHHLCIYWLKNQSSYGFTICAENIMTNQPEGHLKRIFPILSSKFHANFHQPERSFTGLGFLVQTGLKFNSCNLFLTIHMAITKVSTISLSISMLLSEICHGRVRNLWLYLKIIRYKCNTHTYMHLGQSANLPNV